MLCPSSTGSSGSPSVCYLDKYRASEITEYAVHSLSRKYGENVGDRPAVRVLNRARLHAEDLRVGGRRARRKLRR